MRFLNIKFLPGFEVTPIFLPTRSPIDLVMVRPGVSSFYSQTLKGPLS